MRRQNEMTALLAFLLMPVLPLPDSENSGLVNYSSDWDLSIPSTVNQFAWQPDPFSDPIGSYADWSFEIDTASLLPDWSWDEQDVNVTDLSGLAMGATSLNYLWAWDPSVPGHVGQFAWEADPFVVLTDSDLASTSQTDIATLLEVWPAGERGFDVSDWSGPVMRAADRSESTPADGERGRNKMAYRGLNHQFAVRGMTGSELIDRIQREQTPVGTPHTEGKTGHSDRADRS
ncbi:MAG: hypothetical protein DWQ35_05035 [Planctomycetota bacterium]|nr:MAG: hypothetical protein DWQ35_05035 [Planctomycetota bacterium]